MTTKKVNSVRLLLAIVLVVAGLILKSKDMIFLVLTFAGIVVLLTCRDEYEYWYCVRCGSYIGKSDANSNEPPKKRCKNCGCKTFTKSKNHY